MFDSICAPNGALTSKIYSVFAEADGVCRPLSVYTTLSSMANDQHPLPGDLAAVYDEIPLGVYVAKSYFSLLTSDGEVKISAEFHGGADGIEVVDKDFCRDGNRVTFCVSPGEAVMIKIGGLFSNCLRIICNKPENADGKINKDGKVKKIEFAPGYYTADNCDYIVKDEHGFPVINCLTDGTEVHICDGAVVNAAFVLSGLHGVRIYGGGVVSTVEQCYGAEDGFTAEPMFGPLKKFTPPSVFIKTDCSDISIEGITLSSNFRGIVIRNSEDIRIDSVKIFTNCINADGLNMMNARRVSAKNCFIHSQDDCVAVFTSCDSILYLGDGGCPDPVPVSEDIEISHCTLVTACRPFCIGGHATGATDPHDSVRRIFVHDCDLINYRYYDVPDIPRVKKWSGFMRILSQSEQLISDIRFINIRCRKRVDYEGQPIHIEVRGGSDASYTEHGGYRIENVLFENVSFQAKTDIDLPSALYSTADGADSDRCIDGVVFCNVTFGDEPMTGGEDFLEISGNVKNITVI